MMLLVILVVPFGLAMLIALPMWQMERRRRRVESRLCRDIRRALMAMPPPAPAPPTVS
jgi:cytochrome oxidase assembly protein ShyY1